ncbi:MAG: ThiF family adenylyltransferase [Bacteroidales bacterium]
MEERIQGLLSQEEELRYQRQIILHEVGLKKQELLKSAKVLVVGAGGLAAGVLPLLVGMGIGKIVVFDYDVVDTTNLSRQVQFCQEDLGKFKCQQLKKYLEKQNPNTEIIPVVQRFNKNTEPKFFQDVDVIVDACDNFQTRYAIESIAIQHKIPWVYSSVFEFQGQLSVFNYKKEIQYSDLFPNPPEEEPTTKFGKIGIMSSLPTIMGGLQSAEVFKIVTGIGTVFDGSLMTYDLLEQDFKKLNF